MNADSYLVRGIVIVTDRDGHWETRFPDREVPEGVEYSGTELLLNIPSAFRLFASNGEWQAAGEIINLRAEAFTTPGLRGWRAVTLANLYQGEAVARFDEAADAFDADRMPSNDESAREVRHWSSANQQLWSKYFRARARVVESIRTPGKVRELLNLASNALVGTESGWHSSEVSKFHVIVKVLAKLLSDDPLSLSEDEARREYLREMRMTGEVEQDRLALTFISEAVSAFSGFAKNPQSELTRNRLGLALSSLEKIPTIGPDVIGAVRPEIGKKVLGLIMGPVRTWMHRSLGGIRDEAILRQILLRLLQSGLPLYAQIRHGPIEYGKDIVALLNVGDVVVLRHYQVKCGDIDKPKWRQSRDEMEEMFQVPYASMQLPVIPQQTEGVLVTNGHANPYTEPVIGGWLEEQRKTHGRSVEFMHLDTLVDWITKDHLVNELREALKEQGVGAEEI